MAKTQAKTRGALEVGHDGGGDALAARLHRANLVCAPRACHRCVCISLWADHWQLSERMHSAHPHREIDRYAGVGLPEMWRGDPAVRQYSGDQLFDPSGEMPRMQDEDFADVSAGGISDRTSVLGVLLRVWDFGGYAKMGNVFGDHDRAGVHRPEGTYSARRGQFHRLCVRTRFQFFRDADRRFGPVDRESSFSVPSTSTGTILG